MMVAKILGFLFTSYFFFSKPLGSSSSYSFVSNVVSCFLYYTHRIHVWYIYLLLVDFYGKCREIYHTWIVWDISSFPQLVNRFSRHVRQVPGFSNYVWKTTWEKRDLVVCLGKKEHSEIMKT